MNRYISSNNMCSVKTKKFLLIILNKNEFYEMCALVPPFRADDMQGLYKKVIKGKYPRIPEHFSQEMATVIKFMLQVSPSYRPTCEQILSLPIIESLIKKFFPDDVS